MSNIVYVLNGPNLNLLGMREPEIYGSDTLDDIAAMLEDRGRELGLEIDMRQSNHEGHLVDWLHEAQAKGARAVLLNAGAYTHTSIALLDAIKAIRTPVIEVHLSDPTTREVFRHISYVGMAAVDTVQGLGPRSYIVALEKAEPGTSWHAVADEGVRVRDIASVIGRRLGLPVQSVPADTYGPLAPIFAADQPATSTLTRERLGWSPTHPGLLADLENIVP